jgi:tRNA dimethylallyltransferase
MRDAIFIAGPTASGKSAVALMLAERIGGEIISVDSMQVYRGLDIGTAKPTAQERARVRHHLIDVVEINEAFDVAKFLQLAKQTETDIRGRGRVPIYCGGTGLYFKALVAGLDESPKSDSELRRSLESMPVSELLEELKVKDPETFERIDRANSRRVIRALEVIRLTGEKYSAQRTAWENSTQPGHWFGLERDRADLIKRIEQRVDEMFQRGLVDETRELLGNGLEQNPTAMQALGYRQVVENLRGERGLAETIDLVKTKTRQFSKRQMTWFRHQLELRWLETRPSATAESVLTAIWEVVGAGRGSPPEGGTPRQD